MKHALIVAHPKERSLAMAMARRYADTAERLGHKVVIRDLYRMGFDPVLKASELPSGARVTPAPDVIDERQLLGDADVFAFFYPLWFNAPPAILKGYVDRVFCAGFGFEPAAGGAHSLLEGRQLISFTTSGAPEHWVQSSGAMDALMTLFDRHVAGVTGLEVVDHIHEGGVVPGLTDEALEAVLGRVGQVVTARFGRAT